MPVIVTHGLGLRYGRAVALEGVELAIPEGALYALLGPNGAGKSTLLQLLKGLQRPTTGQVRVLGVDPRRHTTAQRAAVGYVAEGLPLPGWMTLDGLERYLAPLYPGWDAGLAAELRRRFRLPGDRRLGRLSRGERTKAALLCALAPRPRVLLLDEPFTGMDALVKDELVGGLLESASAEGWTVVLCSHDIGELEMLADWVGFLAGGRLRLSEPMDRLRERFRQVEVVAANGGPPLPDPVPDGWLAVERSGPRARFLVADGSAVESLAPSLPDAARVDVRAATLREVFVALARDEGERSVADWEVAR